MEPKAYIFLSVVAILVFVASMRNIIGSEEGREYMSRGDNQAVVMGCMAVVISLVVSLLAGLTVWLIFSGGLLFLFRLFSPA